VTALLIGNPLGAIITAHSVLTGAVNALGWSTVVIYVGLSAGHAYCRFAQPAAAGSPAH
jgi:hypothetical protein